MLRITSNRGRTPGAGQGPDRTKERDEFTTAMDALVVEIMKILATLHRLVRTALGKEPAARAGILTTTDARLHSSYTPRWMLEELRKAAPPEETEDGWTIIKVKRFCR